MRRQIKTIETLGSTFPRKWKRRLNLYLHSRLRMNSFGKLRNGKLGNVGCHHYNNDDNDEMTRFEIQAPRFQIMAHSMCTKTC